MPGRFHSGLVVGKFAPLHKGHVLVIQTACAQCEHVVVVSYSNPALPEAGPARQARWLADLFPDTTRLVITDERLAAWFPERHPSPQLPPNDAPAELHRDFVDAVVQRVVGRPIDAVFTSEAYGDGFAEHLTRRARARDPGAPAVTHVAVDPARLSVPVSGTALRNDLWERWQYLPATVARSLVQRVVFLGGESSGKSTLAASMARELGSVSVPEYGRELWAARAGALEFDDYVTIAREQIRREDAACDVARRWLFCDTSPLTTLLYCLSQFGRAAEELEAAAERSYDHVVLCAPDFAFVQDGTRQDAAFRDHQHRWYATALAARGRAFQLAEGSLAQRVETLGAYLRRAELVAPD